MLRHVCLIKPSFLVVKNTLKECRPTEKYHRNNNYRCPDLINYYLLCMVFLKNLPREINYFMNGFWNQFSLLNGNDYITYFSDHCITRNKHKQKIHFSFFLLFVVFLGQHKKQKTSPKIYSNTHCHLMVKGFTCFSFEVVIFIRSWLPFQFWLRTTLTKQNTL